MSDKSNQQISNLMDGELEVNASQFLLKRMASDQSLSITWKHYHLIKSCLQKHKSEALIFDVAHKVSMQLSNQKPEQIHIKSELNRWLKPIIGMSIAASVAFMSVIMLQNQRYDGVQKIDESLPSVVQNNVIQPLQTNISANVATASNTIVPPPSLSRFPSVLSSGMVNYKRGFSHNMNVPYLMIINKSQKASKTYSPILIKEVSD